MSASRLNTEQLGRAFASSADAPASRSAERRRRIVILVWCTTGALAIGAVIGLSVWQGVQEKKKLRNLDFPLQSVQLDGFISNPSGDLQMRKMNTIWTAALAAAALACAGHAQNLVNNGDLEGAAGACAQIFVNPGSTTIPGWVVSGNWNIDWLRSPTATLCSCPSEGQYFVDLNGSPNSVSGSAIRQSIATTPGKLYRLKVSAVSNPYNTPVGTVKILRITTGPLVTDLQMVTSADNWVTCADWLWEVREVNFTADSMLTIIELRSTFPNNAGGILIDEISVVEVSCPGDISGNNAVDGVDLAALLGTWGTNGQGEFDCDIDNDGIVGGPDLTIILGGWGPCPN